MGIPLSIMTLPRVAWQCLIDNMADRLPTWKGSLMHKSRRLAIIKFTLTAVPVHMAIGLELLAWVRKAMIKIMCSFFRTGMDSVQGGKMCGHLEYGSVVVESWRLRHPRP
jgi:hypothetical protein